MKNTHFLIFFLLIPLVFYCRKEDPSAEVITELKVEYFKNPLALSVEQPRFSWIINSVEKNWKQKAYQILVWTDNDTLWNSGKVASDETVNIPYDGKKLSSLLKAQWKVKVWDSNEKTFESEVSAFETGLLASSDWKGKWIGKASEEDTVSLFSGKLMNWIWHPQFSPDPKGVDEVRFFRTSFKVEDTSAVKKAIIIHSVNEKGELSINGKKAADLVFQRLERTDIKPYLVNGINTVEIKAININGKNGLISQIVLQKHNNQSEYFSTGKSWEASIDQKKWVPASVIAAFGKGEGKEWLTEKILAPIHVEPPAYLRKTFELKNKVKSARLYATAKGVYELHLNGSKINENYLAPGWTDYKKRFLYQAYDVTKALKDGKNALGAILGDGWYASAIGWGHVRNNYGPYPLGFLGQLEIEFEDGSRQQIVTDDSWKTTSGPILSSDFLDGEVYDARLELPDWNKETYSDASWKPVVVSGVTEYIMADPGAQAKVIEDISPKKIIEPKEGTYIYDLGQNMVGWVKLKVKGKKGDTIKLRFAEVLNPDSTLYVTNLRSAKATDVFILKGEEEEEYEPHFTFHGFRYVELTGVEKKPVFETITGRVVHSDTPPVGSIKTDNALVNQIFHNIWWGQKGNFLSVPTDCPQRDERLGWMGDAQIFVRTATYNMDVAPFFTKWCLDVRDAQSADGGFSDVSPRLIDLGDGAPAWGDAGVIVPYTIYKAYSDTSILSDSYESMQKWVTYIDKANPDHLWKNRRNADFGDWLSTDANTDKELLGTAFFAFSTKLMAESAKVLGKTADQSKYDSLFQNIKSAFNQAYVSADGKIKGHTQTAYVLALDFNLLPENLRKSAAEHLVEDIKNHGWHHTTGFLGIGHLMPALTNSGHLDVAYKLLNNTTFPSWGYMIKNGATTIWERWDGYTAEKGFQDPGMNSFNHYSLGSVGEWMYSTMAGIEMEEAGFRKIKIRPHPGGGLSEVNGEFNSIRGKIVSHWTLENGVLTLKVKIPANTAATVYFPGEKNEVEGAKFIREEGKTAVYKVGSGEYEFKGNFKG